MEGCVPRILTLSLSFPTQFLSFLFLSLPLHLLSSPRSYSQPQRSSSVSSDPLFLCCQSSVAGTFRFGICSHARRYSDLAIPSSLKLLARAHSGDLAHQRQCDKLHHWDREWWGVFGPTAWPGSHDSFLYDYSLWWRCWLIGLLMNQPCLPRLTDQITDHWLMTGLLTDDLPTGLPTGY